MRTFIIAEAGVNHNGDVKIARQLIDAAVEAGADAVKFQTFKADTLVSKSAPKADYQKRIADGNQSQFEMIKMLELDESAHRDLVDYCKKKGIVFMSSPFDIESINMLNRLGLEILKIPSGEITNLPYLKKIGKLKKRIIMSTGMADLKEIEDALEVLITAGTKKEQITVFHCNTEYPTPFEDVNLKAMDTIKDALNVNVGYSDHTPGIEVPIAAVALGAEVIEKHFTLDKNMSGPDHSASLEPHELKDMVHSIRNIEKALGNGIKKPSPSELKNKPIARKSIVAASPINKGEVISLENITVKRPGTGISPMQWNEVINKKTKRDIAIDSLIQWGDLEDA